MFLNETQTAIRDVAAKFARERVAPRVREFEANMAHPADLFVELAGLGLKR